MQALDRVLRCATAECFVANPTELSLRTVCVQHSIWTHLCLKWVLQGRNAFWQTRSIVLLPVWSVCCFQKLLLKLIAQQQCVKVMFHEITIYFHETLFWTTPNAALYYSGFWRPIHCQNVAVTAQSHLTTTGLATIERAQIIQSSSDSGLSIIISRQTQHRTAIGEQPIKGLLDTARMARIQRIGWIFAERLAITESLTNLVCQTFMRAV